MPKQDLFKRCPRCNGNLVIVMASRGLTADLECLMCCRIVGVWRMGMDTWKAREQG